MREYFDNPVEYIP
jgi:hypothetical protein